MGQGTVPCPGQNVRGELVATYSYNEWGEVTVNATGNNLVIANLNPLRYRGYYYDGETGYYYLQSRYYDPEICRFINADLPEYASEQKDEAAGVNIFVYCCNDAVNNSDKKGTTSYSKKVIVYYYKTKSIKDQPFGHIDMQVNKKVYSFADYKSGNLLITKSIKKYHLHQSKKYSIKKFVIKSTRSEKKEIVSYLKGIEKTFKARPSFDNSNKSGIYQITKGKYKKYKLLSVNCSTFVLDALSVSFRKEIIIYRLVQEIAYPYEILDRPYRVAEIVGWLEESRS